MTNKVIGIGETVLDIVFSPDNKPLSANPGGSTFNAMISIGRSGHRGTFISEVGDDRVGQMIRSFLTDNGIETSCLSTTTGSKSHLALAFLDKKSNAQYSFYKDYKAQRLSFEMPTVDHGDIMLFGSFFALNPQLRDDVARCLAKGRAEGGLLYYDINFRSSHSHERDTLQSTIEENFRLSHIVKASDEDIRILFDSDDWRNVYHNKIAPLCPYFICTEGDRGATLLTSNGEYHVEARKIIPISTIGAGDSFNAGTISSLLDQKTDLREYGTTLFDENLLCAMKNGVAFSAEVCQSLDNYIAKR